MTIPKPTVSWIPPGDAGTRAILSQMVTMIRQGGLDPRVRSRALMICSGIAGRDSAAQIRAIRGWLSQRFVFTRDPDGAEGLFAPWVLLQDIATTGAAHGDCDDAAMLGASLGRSLGLRAQLVTVAFQKDAPMAHVYAELSAPAMGSPWTDLDVTAPAQGPIPPVVRKWQVPV